MAFLGFVIFLSCSEDVNPIDRLTAEDLMAMSSSSGGETSSSSWDEIFSSSSGEEAVSSSSGDDYSSSSSFDVTSSSSSAEQSSSSEAESSSSVGSSSSSVETDNYPSSSSVEVSGSSSSVSSSSSYEPSSSSALSSSSVEASSSSSVPSSSSSEPSSSGAVSSSSSEALCNGETYTDAEFCYGNKDVRLKCGGKTYNENQFCVGSSVYTLCGGSQYNPTEEFCLGGEITPLCGGIYTYTSSQFCADDGKVRNRCGGTVAYTPGEEECCGNGKYTKAIQFCFANTVYNKCDGKDYDPTTHYCHTDGETYSCGNKPYSPSTHFCYEGNSKIGKYCGERTEKYNPDLYKCKPKINPNGIYLKTPVSYGGKSYEAVLIGEQVWMAENLNYAVEGSKCYGEDGEVVIGWDEDNNPITETLSNAEVQDNSVKYGRLYDWATAMGFESSCNSSTCSGQIPPHRSICPSGWHIPSRNDWEILTEYVGGYRTAATKLKAKGGWNENSNGTDEFGFSALPGGHGYSGGSFYSVGDYGVWWSASESSSNKVYYQGMGYDGNGTFWVSDNKSGLLSVRCLQD